ncbi:MAG: radical SAM/SPASM domain-containing protein [bacterium]
MEINLLKYFTFLRLFNALSILFSYCLSKVCRKPVLWGNPISYSIEPTNHCNLKCPECPSGLGALTRSIGLMDIKSFEKIIEQIRDTGVYIQLYFQGEPYINKHLPDMIGCAQSNNLYVSVSTNGLLFKKDMIGRALNPSPDKIIFSIDGLDESAYQNYRVGGSYSNAIEGLKLLIEEKKRRNLQKPFIEFQFIVMKQNEHQANDVVQFGKSIGVDKVTLKTMQVNSFESAEYFLPTNPKYSRYVLSENDFKIKNKIKNHCFALWRTAVITWDGRLVPCCFDKDAKHQFGKLSNNNLIEIWKGENYRKFRMAVLTNRSHIPICTNCTEGLNMNILEM